MKTKTLAHRRSRKRSHEKSRRLTEKIKLYGFRKPVQTVFIKNSLGTIINGVCNVTVDMTGWIDCDFIEELEELAIQ